MSHQSKRHNLVRIYYWLKGIPLLILIIRCRFINLRQKNIFNKRRLTITICVSTQFLFYKNSFYKNHTRLQITSFIRTSEAHILPTIRIIYIGGGVLLLGREIVRISLPLFINRGFHFTRITHICLLFSK